MTKKQKVFARAKTRRCLRCGHCCRSLILEVTGLDILREPRLTDYARKFKDYDYANWQDAPWDVLFLLPSPCPFLQPNGCSIYPTRPNMCVAFQARMDERCLRKERT